MSQYGLHTETSGVCEGRHGAYLQDSLEVAKTLLRVKEEGIGSGAELCEGSIVRSKDGAACHLNTVDELGEVRLFVGEKQGRKLGGEEGQSTADEGWRHQNTLHSMDDTILGSL